MKILLINPPIEDFYFTPQRAYPLGLLYLAASLKSKDFAVEVLNCPIGKKITLKIPQEFRYLARYYKPNKSPFCLFSNYYHFGLTYEEIEQQIRKFNPQIVGVSSNFSSYHDSARKIAQITKGVDKRIITVFGGRFPTVCPEIVLKDKEIDFVIRGEAEESLAELCKNLSKGKVGKTVGLCYKTKDKYKIDKKIALIEDLDSLSFPQRPLIDGSDYKFQGLASAALISSRGCSFSCSFCAINEKFRVRSAKNVFKEITECYNSGIRHFDFEDDNINLNPEFEKILGLLIGAFSGKVKISFMNGILAKGINNNLQEKLVKAGLTHVDLSIISTNEELRKKSLRKEKEDDIFSLSAIMAEKNIPSTVHFIVSLPDQSPKDSLSDLLFLAKERVFLGPSMFYPVIESRFFKRLNEEFLITQEEYKFFRSSCAYFDKFMSRDQIFFVFYLSRIINFIKEIIDKFSLKNNGFADFIKEKTKETYSENNTFSCPEKIDRITLGLVLIRKIAKEGVIFRVEEKLSNDKFNYQFFPEKFISKEELKGLLKSLIVRGVLNDSCIELKSLIQKDIIFA